jgi:hypothetical protein
MVVAIPGAIDDTVRKTAKYRTPGLVIGVAMRMM